MRILAVALKLHALPPGEMEVAFQAETYILDVNLGAVVHEIAVGSDRLGRRPDLS